MNTRNKRASALGFALAALVVLPAPDAAIAQADKQQVAFSYSGVLAAPAQQIDVDPTRIWLVDARVTTWTVTARETTWTVTETPTWTVNDRVTTWTVDTRTTTWTVE